jgi:TniQ
VSRRRDALPAGWDESVLPARSRLHPLDPIGLGTALVESATSYCMRLAAAHRLAVGVLILESMGPAIGRSHAYGADDVDGHYFSSLLSESPSTINGSEGRAALFRLGLEALTLRTDLAALTMWRWRRVLWRKGVLRDELAYCPVCLAEWRAAQVPIYHPLIWHLSAVTVCGRHGVLLRTRCATCGEVQAPLTFWSRVGHCTNVDCGQWLGGTPSERPATPDAVMADWQALVWREVGQLVVAGGRGEPPPTGAGIASAITASVEAVSGGNGAAFGRAVGVARSLVCDWRAGRSNPSLPSALRICAVGGYRLSALLEGNLVRHGEPLAASVVPDRRPAHEPVDWQGVRLALAGVVAGEGYPPKTLESVLIRFRADYREAQRRFPDLCEAVVAKGDAWRRERQRARVAAAETSIRSAVADLERAGVRASKWRVQALTGLQVREAPFQEAWHDARRAHAG